MNTARRQSPSQSTGLVFRYPGPGIQPQRQRRRRHRHNVQPEHRSPSRIVRQGAAHERPDAEAQHQETGPGADGARALRFGGGFGHCRQRAGNGEGRAEPLQRACADDHGSVGSERDHHRGESEQRDPAGGGPSRPELVRCLAAQNDEDGGGKQIGVHRPFHRRGTELEASRHLRQRGHDGRAVLADRQHRQATGDQHQGGITRHSSSKDLGHPKTCIIRKSHADIGRFVQIPHISLPILSSFNRIADELARSHEQE